MRGDPTRCRIVVEPVFVRALRPCDKTQCSCRSWLTHRTVGNFHSQGRQTVLSLLHELGLGPFSTSVFPLFFPAKQLFSQQWSLTRGPFKRKPIFQEPPCELVEECRVSVSHFLPGRRDRRDPPAPVWPARGSKWVVRQPPSPTGQNAMVLEKGLTVLTPDT